LTGAGVTVMAAAADLVPSATDVAVRVTPAGFGRLAGAVYVIAAPDALAVAESEPHLLPLQPAPESVHFTPLFCASFCTVAEKFLLPPPA
jgi:hypothetical protein